MNIKKKSKLFGGGGGFQPTKKHPGSGNLFSRFLDPSRNRLASTAYFTKPGFSVLHAWVRGIKKQNQIWSNLHERSRIGLIKIKIKFQIFQVMIIVVIKSPQFSIIFSR